MCQAAPGCAREVYLSGLHQGCSVQRIGAKAVITAGAGQQHEHEDNDGANTGNKENPVPPAGAIGVVKEWDLSLSVIRLLTDETICLVAEVVVA